MHSGLTVNSYIMQVMELCSAHFITLTLTLPGPSASVSGSLDSYCSLKPLCCHYPVSKCCNASIIVTSTVRVNVYIHNHTFACVCSGEMKCTSVQPHVHIYNSHDAILLHFTHNASAGVYPSCHWRCSKSKMGTRANGDPYNMINPTCYQ